jgi:CRP-like cAMP-binding protein
MIIQEADLFRDLRQETMTDIAATMVEESYPKGSVLFKAGEPADSFYLIVDGRVRLAVGTEAEIDYTASRPGEAFGWTGMVGRTTYVASAECATPCRLAKIEKEKLERILERDPATGMLFYKRLAAAVVQRLIDNYGMFLSEGSLKGVTYGTGQVMGSEE